MEDLNKSFPFQILLSNLPRVNKEEIWKFLGTYHQIIPDAIKIIRSDEDIVARLYFETEEPMLKLASKLNNTKWLNSILHAQVLITQGVPDEVVNIKAEYTSDEEELDQDLALGENINERKYPKKTSMKNQRVTYIQKRRMMALTEQNKHLLICSGKVGDKVSKKSRDEFWDMAALELNSLGGAVRSGAQWKKSYNDMQSLRKKHMERTKTEDSWSTNEGEVSTFGNLPDCEPESNASVAAETQEGHLDQRVMMLVSPTLSAFLSNYVPSNGATDTDDEAPRNKRRPDGDPDWKPTTTTAAKPQPPVPTANQHQSVLARRRQPSAEQKKEANRLTPPEHGNKDEEPNETSVEMSLRAMAESFRLMAEAQESMATAQKSLAEAQKKMAESVAALVDKVVSNRKT